MHLFITGGAGYVGSAVTRALTGSGHRVTALARTAEQDRHLRSLDADPLRGDLRDPSSYATAASAADAIIHLAAPRGADRSEVGRLAIDTLLASARAGSHGHFVYTSVLFVLGDTPSGADESTAASGAAYADRAELERRVLAASEPGLTCAVVRPGMVYGGGGGGKVSEMFRTARLGKVEFIGDGRNRWSLVHRDDLASLFRLVVETREAGVLHGTDGVPLPVEEVARHAAAAAGGAAVQSVALEDAREVLGPFADALCLDQPVQSPRARALGWTPVRRSFVDSAGAAFEEYQTETDGGRP